MAENGFVAFFSASEPEPVPEHFLALLYGFAAVLLGAAVWSGIGVLSNLWSLLAVPGMGWIIGWSCLHGGRRGDTFIRASAWVLTVLGVVLGLFAQSAFSVVLGSPDSEFQARAAVLECWHSFAEPPWFGSASVLLALFGASRALRRARTETVVTWHREASEGAPGALAAPAPPASTVAGARLVATNDPGSRAA
ncbi:MAG TPA: hypothetical protein VMS88_02140 [Terriglobales bacterium]|nr:hypothetical protein [Terriglobales bacterium]